MLARPRFVRRVRRVGLVATSILWVVMTLRGAGTGRLVVMGALVAALLAAEVIWRGRGRPNGTRAWPLIAYTILGVMSVVIGVTGGVRSVLLILYVPAAFTLGLSTPAPNRSLALAPVALIAALAALAEPLSASGVSWMLSWEIGADPSGDAHNALLPLAIALFSLASFQLGRAARMELVESRRRAERAQQAELEAHAERHAQLLAMVGAVAHELKNPLTTVQSLTSHLHRKAPADSMQYEALTVMRGEVGRIRGTVDALLNTARPLASYVMTTGDLNEVAVEVVSTHRALAAERGVSMRCIPSAAHAAFDRRKLFQVAGNLVLNAIEACNAGGTIEIEVGEQGTEAWFEVRDDGPGLAPEVRSAWGRPGVTTKVGGSGIGLALSRGIVEQHDGRLILSNGTSGGCVARVWLPREREPAA